MTDLLRSRFPPLPRPLDLLACIGLGLSGVVHLAITPEHSAHAPAHGLFFSLLGVLQVGWAVAYWLLPRRWLRWAGIGLAGGPIVLWTITLSAPTPFEGTPQTADLPGIFSKALEAAALVSLARAEAGASTAGRQRAWVGPLGFGLALALGAMLYFGGRALEAIAPTEMMAIPDPPAGQTITAHGHETDRRIRLQSEPAGPYLLRVVTSADPEEPLGLIFEVRVVDAASGATVTDAAVHLSGSPAGGSNQVEAAAVQGAAPIPRDYGAQVILPAAGPWEFAVTVDGDRGWGRASFQQLVAGGGGAGAAISAYLPFGGLFLLIIAYLLLSRTRPPAV